MKRFVWYGMVERGWRRRKWRRVLWNFGRTVDGEFQNMMKHKSIKYSSDAMMALASLAVAAPPAAPHVTFVVDRSTGMYSVALDGETWYKSVAPDICIAGSRLPLQLLNVAASSGIDNFGAWTGKAAAFGLNAGGNAEPIMVATFKAYSHLPHLSLIHI